MEQNHAIQRPNRDQYLPPKEENTESTMKLWFYEEKLRQMENENVRINARLDKLEMLGSFSQQNQNSTSHTRRRRNRNRTKKNLNGRLYILKILYLTKVVVSLYQIIAKVIIR